MNEETHQKLMTIKRSFRLLMNGPGSQSMRDKGLGYKLNWGVPFYELKKMAGNIGERQWPRHQCGRKISGSADSGYTHYACR